MAKKHPPAGDWKKDFIEPPVAGGGVQDDGTALLSGADGTDGSPPPVAGRTRRDEIVPQYADPSGNAANDGSLAGGGGEHDKNRRPWAQAVLRTTRCCSRAHFAPKTARR